MVPLSVDHVPSDPSEQIRVRQCGGVINRMTRFANVLDVTRAFGDLELSHVGMSCEPHTFETTLGPADKLVILTSDGIWKVLNPEHVTDILCALEVQQRNSPQTIADALIKQAMSMKAMDNLTVMVIKLDIPESDTFTSPETSSSEPLSPPTSSLAPLSPPTSSLAALSLSSVTLPLSIPSATPPLMGFRTAPPSLAPSPPPSDGGSQESSPRSINPLSSSSSSSSSIVRPSAADTLGLRVTLRHRQQQQLQQLQLQQQEQRGGGGGGGSAASSTSSSSSSTGTSSSTGSSTGSSSGTSSSSRVLQVDIDGGAGLKREQEDDEDLEVWSTLSPVQTRGASYSVFR